LWYPFQLEFEDPQTELLEPTITGTTNALQAVSEEQSVTSVVIVASVASYNMAYPMPIPGALQPRALDIVGSSI
jgi:dihydroflavonol-4-reductase